MIILEFWFVGPSIFFLFKQVLLCCRATWLRKTQMSFSTHAFSKTSVKVVNQLANQMYWNGQSNGPDK